MSVNAKARLRAVICASMPRCYDQAYEESDSTKGDWPLNA